MSRTKSSVGLTIAAAVTVLGAGFGALWFAPRAAAVDYFYDGFEGGLGGWSVAGTSASVNWHQASSLGDPCFGAFGHPGAPFAGSNTAAYHRDDAVPLQCTYDDGLINSGTLATASGIVLPGVTPIRLRFFSWHFTEASPNFDVMTAEVSSDDGGTWDIVVDVKAEGYPEMAWNDAQANLSAYAGMTILLRFAFDTGDDFANDYAGWHIDEVRIDDQPVTGDTLSVTPTVLAPASVQQGTPDVAMLALDLSAAPGPVNVDGITVQLSGLPPDPADVANVEIWGDNGDGLFDPSSDFTIGGAPLAGGPPWEAAVLFFFPLTVNPGPGPRLFIVYDVPLAATVGNWIGARLPDATYIDVVGSADTVDPTNFPIESYAPGVQTEIVAATADVLLVTPTILAPPTVDQGTGFVAMLQIDLSTAANFVVVDGVTVILTGLPPDVADIDFVSLFLDNGDGVFTPFLDPFLGASPFPFVPLTYVDASPDVTVSAANPQTLFIAYSIAMTATPGNWVGARLNGPGAINVFAPDSVDGTNFPIDSYAVGVRTEITAPPVDTLTVAGSAIAPNTAEQGEPNVPMLRLGLTASPGDVAVNGLTVRLTGAPPDPADVVQAGAWRDNGDGVFDSGIDVLLGTAAFGAGPPWEANFFFFPVTVSPGSPVTLFLTLDVAGGAIVGDYVGLSVPDATFVFVSFPDVVDPSGFPFDSYAPAVRTQIIPLSADILAVAGTSLSPATVGQWATGVEMYALDLSTSSGSVVVGSLDVDFQGAPGSPADVRAISAWVDANLNSVVDAGDSRLAAVPMAATVNLPLGAGLSVTPAQPRRVLIAYDIDPAAVVGDFVGLRLADATYVNLLSAGDSVDPTSFPLATLPDTEIVAAGPPQLVSAWATVPPAPDGAFGPGEYTYAAANWADLTMIGANGVPAHLLVMNDATFLYVLYDAFGDRTNDVNDASAIGFDTDNNDLPTNAADDELGVIPFFGGPFHAVYDGGAGDWVTEDPCDPGFAPDHAGLACAVGFGGSPNDATPHRIVEYSVPLALIDVPAGPPVGYTLGFGGMTSGGMAIPGIFDFGTFEYDMWPTYLFGPPIDVDQYGDLVLAAPPVDTGPPIVSITSHVDGQWVIANPVPLAGTAADDVSLDRVEVSCDNGATWNVATGTSSWTYDCPVAPGANVIHARAFDWLGQESAHAILTLNFDPAPPTVDILAPADGSWSNTASVLFGGTAVDGESGLDRVEVSCDNGATWSVATGPSPWIHSCTLAEGPNVIHARAFDVAGWESVHFIITVNVDTTPPTVTITNPLDGSVSGTTPIIVDGTATDAGSGVTLVQVSCDNGVTWTDATGTSFWTMPACNLVPGANTIHARSFDAVGWESPHHIITVTFVPPGPTTVITSHADGQWVITAAITVAGTASPNPPATGINEVWVSCDDGATWNLATGTNAWSIVCSLLAGANVLHAYAIDDMAISGPHAIITVNFDPDPPTVSIAAPTDGQYLPGNNVMVGGNAADTGGSGLDRVEVSCDDGATWNVAAGTTSWTYPCGGFTEGPNLIHARAFDAAGWESGHIILTVYMDTTGPTVSIANPLDGTWFATATVPVDGTAADAGSGVASVDVSCDDGVTWSPAAGTNAWSATCSALPEGPSLVHARAFDAMGWESLHAIITVNVDTIPPSVSITSHADLQWITSTSINLAGTAADGGSGITLVQVSCDGGTTWTAAAGTTSWSAACTVVAGASNVHARSFDNVGLESAHAIITLQVDTVSPTVTIDSPADGATVNTATFTVSGTALDADSGVALVEVSCDGGTTWTPATGTTSWSAQCIGLADGSYVIVARVTDVAGNVGLLDSSDITVDTAAPTVAMTQPSPTSNVPWTANVVLSFSEAMNQGSVVALLTPATASSSSWTGNDLTLNPTANLQPGTTYTVTVSGTDVAGNALTGTTIFTFTTAANADPTVTISAPAAGAELTGGTTGYQITFTIGDAEDANTALAVEVRVFDGTSWTVLIPAGTSGTANPNSVAWTVPKVTTTVAQIEITVTDSNGGSAQATVTFSIRDKTAPTGGACSLTTTTLEANQDVTITASATDDYGGAVAFTITVKRGGTTVQTFTTSPATFKPTEAGDYTVECTPRDAANNAGTAGTANLRVTEPPSAFPWWILLILIAAIVAVLLFLLFGRKKKKPEEAPPPAPAGEVSAPLMPAPPTGPEVPPPESAPAFTPPMPETVATPESPAATAPRVCTNCGAPAPIAGGFCGNCGAPIA